MQSAAEITLDPERSYEVVDSDYVGKEIPAARHSEICGLLTVELGIYLKANNLGRLYPEASFQIGKNERIPDLAFVAKDRIPPEGPPETKWLIVPDLAVEVISPNDFYEKVHAKALEYLSAGVKQVWIVSPENQTVTIYRSATNIMAFPPESALVSQDLLPGFRCSLREIFKNPVPLAE